jgi:iron complex outermembrane receptor protein
MKAKRTPIASAVALALMSAMTAAHAQDAAPAAAAAASAPQPAQAASAPAATEKPVETAAPAKGTQNLEAVIVTGIRGSLQQSLNKKRNADSFVEVITAEDIGKMPDKNVADSLQRVPGVNISSAGAGEGGFDEADRVSLRGTNPSLTQTMINGHMVGSGDWFVLNQVGTVGRSVSYSLLPSELVGAVVVNKSSRADLVEGGVAGTVDIQTRKPLDFKKQLTLEATAGAVYADLPEKTDPQFNALFNWKNDADTFGVLIQGFSEKRHLRRDGQEMLGYTAIKAGSAIALSNPDLAGVLYPNGIGSALFEQERKREGAFIDLQIKPTNDLTLDLSGFRSKMEATNYNRNYLIFPSKILDGGNGQAPDPGYVVRNGTLVSANFTNIGVPGQTPSQDKQYGIVDQIYRPGANAVSDFYNLDGKWNVTDKLTLLSKIGTSKGKGETPKQAVYEQDILNTGASYTLHGIGSPADAALPGINQGTFNVPGQTRLDWVFGASPAATKDKENWGQIDGEYALEAGTVTGLKFGARFAEHKRESTWTAQGPGAGAFDNLPAWNGTTYPGNFGGGLGGGNFPHTPWQLDPAALEAWGDKYSNRDPVSREYWPGEFSMREKNTAVYLMANLEGSSWSGNVGVRVVRTNENVTQNIAISAGVDPATVPGAITSSAFGPFYRNDVKNSYTDVLPSLNLKYDLSKDLVARFGLAKTMARPDYSALAGSVSLDELNHTGSGGNPNLEPIRSTNVDAGLEWYFAPRSMVSASLFYMDLKNYVSYGTTQTQYMNIRTGVMETFSISSPTNSSGKVQGLELSYQQPIWGGFGALANYTYADAEETGGGPLVGASKNTYNLTGYFENDSFSARVNYSFRSKFYNGLDRSTAQYQDDTDNVSASIGYKINDNLTVTLDGMNLNNPKLKYYANNPDQPTAFYVNGRQYYLSLRLKM